MSIHKLQTLLVAMLIVGSRVALSQSQQKGDTVFILNERDHKIFIDTNKESKFYDKVSNFTFTKFGQQSYDRSLAFLKKEKLKLIKVKPNIPWKKWIPLMAYKGKFYVYHPSDFYFHFMKSINDSTFIDWTGEGPVANKIIAHKKTGKNSYQLLVSGENAKARRINIQIDPKNGTAVFREVIDGHEDQPYVMIAAEKIRTVPIIVNYSPTEKQEELQFDHVTFPVEVKRAKKR
jgi:hypothetical protein